jgi:hypothetical protein
MTNQHPLISTLLLILVLLATEAFSQNNNAVDKLRAAFQDFRYKKVIFMADSIIVHSTDLKKKDLLEIYRLKAVSHYSIGQQNYSELAFKSILQVDSNYVLEPSINAPKIIRLFNTIKQKYKPISKENKPMQLLGEVKIRQVQKDYIAATARSVIFPGWGHNYLQKGQGTWFMAGSAILIPLSVYFTAASWHYEQKYLNEIDPQKIESRFRKYDDTYKTRNIVLGAYLIYWAYIQYDFFRQGPGSANESKIVLNLSQNRQQQFLLSLNIPF